MTDVRYVVTGVTVGGQRFRLSSVSAAWALAINLYRGSVWLETTDDTGKKRRKLLRRVFN